MSESRKEVLQRLLKEAGRDIKEGEFHEFLQGRNFLTVEIDALVEDNLDSPGYALFIATYGEGPSAEMIDTLVRTCVKEKWIKGAREVVEMGYRLERLWRKTLNYLIKECVKIGAVRRLRGLVQFREGKLKGKLSLKETKDLIEVCISEHSHSKGEQAAKLGGRELSEQEIEKF